MHFVILGANSFNVGFILVRSTYFMGKVVKRLKKDGKCYFKDQMGIFTFVILDNRWFRTYYVIIK